MTEDDSPSGHHWTCSRSHSSQLTPRWTREQMWTFWGRWFDLKTSAALRLLDSLLLQRSPKSFHVTWSHGGSVESEQRSRSLSKNKDSKAVMGETLCIQITAKCETSPCLELTLSHTCSSLTWQSECRLRQQTVRWPHTSLSLCPAESPQGVDWHVMSDEASSWRPLPPLWLMVPSNQTPADLLYIIHRCFWRLIHWGKTTAAVLQVIH